MAGTFIHQVGGHAFNSTSGQNSQEKIMPFSCQVNTTLGVPGVKSWESLDGQRDIYHISHWVSTNVIFISPNECWPVWYLSYHPLGFDQYVNYNITHRVSTNVVIISPTKFHLPWHLYHHWVSTRDIYHITHKMSTSMTFISPTKCQQQDIYHITHRMSTSETFISPTKCQLARYLSYHP